MILDDIIKATKSRYKSIIKNKPFKMIKAEAKQSKFISYSFYNSLKGLDIKLICEIKKASPSKGIISREFPYLEIAKAYQEGLANAISVLTEPTYFLGKDIYLSEIKQIVNLPILRKDFILKEYQIYETKAIGADAVLLIASILNIYKLRKFIKVANNLNIDCLVECHNEKEIKKALNAKAKIIGVNNRNLKDFTINMHNAINLRKFVKDDTIFVAESGIKNYDDIKNFLNEKINVFLVGETLMKAHDITKEIAKLKGMN